MTTEGRNPCDSCVVSVCDFASAVMTEGCLDVDATVSTGVEGAFVEGCPSLDIHSPLCGICDADASCCVYCVSECVSDCVRNVCVDGSLSILCDESSASVLTAEKEIGCADECWEAVGAPIWWSWTGTWS